MLENIKFVAVEQGVAPRYRVVADFLGENRQVLLTLDESAALRIMTDEEKLSLAERKLVSEEELNELNGETLVDYMISANREKKRAEAAASAAKNSGNKYAKGYKDLADKRHAGIMAAIAKIAKKDYQTAQYNEGVEESNTPLCSVLKSAFASQYAFYLKAHFCHWNVEGSDFTEFHNLFGDIYEEVFGILDDFAENIRKCGDYAPGSFESLLKLSKINGFTDVKAPMEMASSLLEDSNKLADIFGMVYRMAEAKGEFGLANFLADRQDAQRKHSWMLTSTLKGASDPILPKEDARIEPSSSMNFKIFNKLNREK